MPPSQSLAKKMDFRVKYEKYSKGPSLKFVIFKSLNYCFEETIRFDVKTAFASHPVSRLFFFLFFFFYQGFI